MYCGIEPRSRGRSVSDPRTKADGSWIIPLDKVGDAQFGDFRFARVHTEEAITVDTSKDTTTSTLKRGSTKVSITADQMRS